MIDREFILCFWFGCAIMGFAYLFIMPSDESPAFVFSQILAGILGIIREIKEKHHG